MAPAVSAAPPADASMAQVFPMEQPPLYLSEANGRVFVSMALSGLAWFEMGAEGAKENVHFRADLPTLDVQAFGGDKLIVSSRHSVLSLAKLNEEGSGLKSYYEWPAEGLGTAIARKDKMLAVAAGGAGVTLFHWMDYAEAPDLVGRYPFVNFARDVEIIDSETLVVADAQSAAAVILDVSDPMRPQKRVSLPVNSFCDSIAVIGESIACTDRTYGTFYYETPLAEPPGKVQFIEALAPRNMEYPHVQSVEFRDGLMMIAENEGGVRFFRQDGEKKWIQVHHDQGKAPVFDAIFLSDGRVAIAEARQVRIERLGELRLPDSGAAQNEDKKESAGQ